MSSVPPHLVEFMGAGQRQDHTHQLDGTHVNPDTQLPTSSGPTSALVMTSVDVSMATVPHSNSSGISTTQSIASPSTTQSDVNTEVRGSSEVKGKKEEQVKKGKPEASTAEQSASSKKTVSSQNTSKSDGRQGGVRHSDGRQADGRQGDGRQSRSRQTSRGTQGDNPISDNPDGLMNRLLNAMFRPEERQLSHSRPMVLCICCIRSHCTHMTPPTCLWHHPPDSTYLNPSFSLG